MIGFRLMVIQPTRSDRYPHSMAAIIVGEVQRSCEVSSD